VSATTEQKVDFLLKKVGFTLSKTGSVTGTGSISGGTTKEPFAESIPSPLVVPDSSIWNQSLSIPTTPPGSDTSIVKVYSTSSAHRMTADSSVSGSRAFIAYSTYNNTSSARLTDWIDTQFGTAYVLKVYKGDPNSGGTLLPAGGSGSNDGWFFDYSSGVLNFNGSGLPSGVTDSNIYIVGYRYIGSKGVSSPGQINPTNLFVAGISTFVGVGTFQSDLSVAGQIKGFTNLSAPHSDTVKTYTVTVASKDSSHRYQGQGSTNGYLIDGIFSPFLTLTPGRTYKFDQSDNSNSGHPLRFYLEADKTTQYSTNVTTNGSPGSSGAYTQIVVGDETPIVLHYQCSAHGYMGNAVQVNSNVVNTNYAATLRGGLTANSAKVEDLTSGRVVLAGTGGELEDNSNLTFNGSQLGITGTVNASSTITGTEFHTGASGSAIRVTSNTISGPATFTLDPAAVGNNTGKVIIAGDLQVDGTTTTVNSTTVNIVDKNIQVATGAANDAAANGGGITIASGSGNKTFQFEATGSNLGSSENLNLASGKDYKINNTSVLNATTLGSGVVNSSLTNVGTLTSLDVSGLVGIGSLTVAGVSTFSGAIDGTSAILTGNITANRFTGTDGNAITLGDNKKIVLGTGSDFEIFHSGNNSFIKDTGTGSLTVNTSQLLLRNAANNQEAVKFTEGGAVEVYHAGVKKFQSNSEGVLFQGVGTNVDGSKLILALGDGSNKRSFIQGTSNSVDQKGIQFKTYSSAAKTPLTLTHDGHLKVPDDSKFKIGTGEDLEIFHDGIHSRIVDNAGGGGATIIQTNHLRINNLANTKNYARFFADAQVELFFNASRKLETTNTGVVVTGIVSATTFQGNATTATDLKINGTNQIVYQDSNNDSDVLPTGSAGQILASSGAGAAPQWVNSAPAGAIEGITIREESSIVGTANSISTINFIGSVVTADAAAGAGIATVTVNAIAGLGISEGSGSKATGATGLDFVGPLIGVDASSNTGISTVRVDALTIKDEGSTVGTAGSITTINFVGSGIAAAVSGDTATVTSSGGVTNADVVALAIALG
jgi:hypothetical protein